MRPLFILAPARSFTSVLCAMIGSHPELMALAENHLFLPEKYTQKLAKYRPQTRHGLLRVIAELGLGGQTELNIDAARTWLDEHEHLSGPEIFRDLAAWTAPRELVDKSPIYAANPDALRRMRGSFPDGRFLHVTRHPRETCESIYRLVKAPGRRQQFVEDDKLRRKKCGYAPTAPSRSSCKTSPLRSGCESKARTFFRRHRFFYRKSQSG